MKGFFKKEDINPLKYKGTDPPCVSCKLCNDCLSPKMKPTGEGKKKVLFIAEAPGKQEDEQNSQLVGESGQVLRDVLKSYNFDLDRDGWKDNACRCRPISNSGGNRTPTDREISVCRPCILQTIKELQPEKIILLGASAIKSVIGDRISIGGIGRWVGQKIPDQDLDTWIFPTYHPSYLVRNQGNIPLENVFRSNINNALSWNKKLPDYHNEEKKISIFVDVKPVISYLEWIYTTKQIIAFDYETTGLKPHKAGHRILCMSISTAPHQAVSFPIFEDKDFLCILKKVLADPDVKKIAHSMNFEHSWSKFIFGVEVGGWLHDTQLTAHVLDNRSSTPWLKFQVYTRYGVAGYDKCMEEYINSRSKDSNAFNKMDKAPIKEMLAYCGMDSMFTYRLYKDQKNELDKHLMIGNEFLLRGNIELAKIECNGICIDDYSDVLSKIEKKLSLMLKNLYKMNEAKKWELLKGKKLNPSSDTQLRELLFKILGYKTDRVTNKGDLATDKEVLAGINTPFTKLVLEISRFSHIQKTIEGFVRESVNGVIRPFFRLTQPRTYRSSSSNPNFQNVPKRDNLALKLIRKGFKPRPGHILLEADYSGIEVAIGACYHKDPQMIKYITDDSTDMHRDQAIEIYKLRKDQITKNIRQTVKGSFVFPEFYGSYYIQCAKNLWKIVDKEKTSDGILLRENLISKGIKHYSQFEKHIEQVEYKFWNCRFKMYAKWKKNIWNFYQKYGYVELFTGFRCSGLMSRKDVTNYPIQGTAFHCLLWSLTKINQKLDNWNSKIVGQIHDSIIIDTDPNELEDLVKLLHQVMCKDIKNQFKWIIVPLSIEIETSEVDGNWAEMEKYVLPK